MKYAVPHLKKYQFLKGMTPWNFNGGLPLCKDCGRKLSTYKNKLGVCNKCKGQYKNGSKHPMWKGGLPSCLDCNKQLSRMTAKHCRNCWSFYYSGEKTSNWKGGITPINKAIRNSFEYEEWRTKVFERDDYTCQDCGAIGEYLNADHIKPFAFYPELRFELSNGRTLCVPCHRKTDTFAGKGHKRFRYAGKLTKLGLSD